MQEYQYKFSIVVPVYNAEKYVAEALDSVIHQFFSFKDVQVILVNDGSSDASDTICREYQKKYPDHIVYLEQENQGVSAARNLGIKNATGKYILFLDADDRLKRNVLASVSHFFDAHYDEVDIVVYPLKYKFNKKIRLRNHFRYKKEYTKGTGVYDIEEYPKVIQTTINYCIKNEGANNQLFNEEIKFSEDEEFATRMIMKKRKIGYCSNCFYVYRKHQASTNAAYSISQKVFEKFYKHYHMILTENECIPYIQNLLLNTLRWRLTDHKLWPDTHVDEHHKNVEDLKELLQDIDVSVIAQYPNMNIFHKLYLCKLKNCFIEAKVTDHSLKLYVDGILYYEEKRLPCYLQSISNKEGTLYMKGIFLSPFFAYTKPIVKLLYRGNAFPIQVVKSDYTYLTDLKTEDFYGFAYELPCQCNESIQLIAEIEGIPFDLYPIFSEKGKTYGCDAEFLYVEKEGCLLVKPTNGKEKRKLQFNEGFEYICSKLR